MRRPAALLAAAASVLALAACSAPSNNPCLYDNGVEHTHLTHDGKTLLIVCRDGKIIVRHP